MPEPRRCGASRRSHSGNGTLREAARVRGPRAIIVVLCDSCPWRTGPLRASYPQEMIMVGTLRRGLLERSSLTTFRLPCSVRLVPDSEVVDLTEPPTPGSACDRGDLRRDAGSSTVILPFRVRRAVMPAMALSISSCRRSTSGTIPAMARPWHVMMRVSTPLHIVRKLREMSFRFRGWNFAHGFLGQSLRLALTHRPAFPPPSSRTDGSSPGLKYQAQWVRPMRNWGCRVPIQPG